MRVVRILEVDGLRFKDLNKNGKLDIYEDWRRPIEERVNDLVSQMTVEEKAGMMVGPTLPMGPNGTVSEKADNTVSPFGGGMRMLATSEALNNRHITQFINRVNTDAKTMATWLNSVQQLAEGTRLGIPAFFVTNPRNHVAFEIRLGIDEASRNFSQWPGTLGLAATRDPALVEEFASIAAKEYVAVGIRGAYHPQIDLSTEPRWARISGTLGEDAELTRRMTVALVRGFQGKILGSHSVALTVKHFPGGGPVREGQDSHFEYGKNQVYPGKNFDYHLIPFKAAIQNGAAAVMPYYSIPKGITSEDVGMAFNKDIITGLLRNKLGFKGIVNSDSGITTSMAWGVENLTVGERYKKAIEAGTDLIGNDATPEYIVELVKAGQLSESRIDESVRRILRARFALGIFENPYVDPEQAAKVVASEEFQKKADLAQRKSIVLLKNSNTILPLKTGLKVYLEGLDPAVATRYGYSPAATVEDADVCILKVTSGGRPGTPRRSGAEAPSGQAPAGRGVARAMGSLSTGGQPIVLTLAAEQLEHIRAIMKGKPTVVVMNLDRPYVIPEIAGESAALLGTFGVTDRNLFEVLSGKFAPTAKLPFELPSSMDAVRVQKEDVPFDSKDPLFKFGAGLSYSKAGRSD
ncbi:MAG: glycoside hydrolase family 3 protein [Acidobacteria bacterium]|nr:MAG: glycoside hydrolase family 3 protein [Acidobacteriota bacterium]